MLYAAQSVTWRPLRALNQISDIQDMPTLTTTNTNEFEVTRWLPVETIYVQIIRLIGRFAVERIAHHNDMKFKNTEVMGGLQLVLLHLHDIRVDDYIYKMFIRLDFCSGRCPALTSSLVWNSWVHLCIRKVNTPCMQGCTWTQNLGPVFWFQQLISISSDFNRNCKNINNKIKREMVIISKTRDI